MDKKLISFIFVAAVFVFAATAVLIQRASREAAPVPVQPAPAAAPAKSAQTYSNSQYSFFFHYPDPFILAGPQDNPIPYVVNNYFIRHGAVVVSAAIPKSTYVGTNFQSAFITFAVDSVTANNENCKEYTDYQTTNDPANELGYRSLPMVQTRTVGETIYYYAELADAVAGTRSMTRIYHLLKNKICYEASLNLFTTNIANYDPGQVTAVDEMAVWQRLENVLATLKFSP